jgi:hypothetical protein
MARVDVTVNFLRTCPWMLEIVILSVHFGLFGLMVNVWTWTGSEIAPQSDHPAGKARFSREETWGSLNAGDAETREIRARKAVTIFIILYSVF